ncbi:MAG: matrixin family metalloprotease [Sideroxydans sp.]|nr:matrixin family metalloprotease [Sideroxydans sp.]
MQNPKHGVIRLVTEADRGTFFSSKSGPINPAYEPYAYLPEQGYLGNDSATFLVDFGGKIVKVVYYFKVVDHPVGNDGDMEICKSGPYWKISSTLAPNGTSTLTSVEYQQLTLDAGNTTTDISTLASTLDSSILSSLSVDPTAVTLNIADLPNAAVGQTTGSTITLDTTASGYGWFIDPTPADNSEYLPTSNPFEWVAKAGSEAAGKMDMLTVLLHEYGHALGINHSADPNDYMGATLTAGVRRLPSAEEMVLMQGLVAQAKDGLVGRVTPADAAQQTAGVTRPTTPAPFPTLPLGGMSLAFVGLLRSSRYGGLSIAPDGSTLVTQYDWAANPAFASLDNVGGWSTEDGVDFAPADPSTSSVRTASATLNEISTSQTRLSQVFMLNTSDRYLSFTLSGTALDNLTGAPDDAFEVALLDANTGLSLLGSNGLTRSDAFLNLQADGTQNAADCVTCTNNADGSRTYRVDLTGISAGTVANLSFDLIGFGQNGSHITVQDVRVSGLPQLHDDSATLAEDNQLTFDPFAQADTQLKPLLVSHIVDAPTHGAVTVNADGSVNSASA